MIHENNSELFDGDPIENLKIENEIFKLKMQAERGAHFFSNEDVPPEIEALFLHNVNEFEKAWENAKMVSIYDFIGQPSYKSCETMEEGEIQHATDHLLFLLAEKNIQIEKPVSIEPAVFYRFLTEELFKQEIEEMELEGFFRCFDYYEFHPDHKQDIKTCAERFLDNWFRKNTEGLKWDLDKNIVLPHGPILSSEEAMERINRYFDSIIVLKGGHFQISDTKFQWSQDDDNGVGHAEGILYYEVENEDSSTSKFGGPFMIYMSNHYGFWGVCYFEIPGFYWEL